MIIFVFIGLILISMYGLYKYIEFTNKWVTSDAVFVKSDTLTNLSFKLPGKIAKIYVNEGDKIKKGGILARLDTKDLEIQKREIIKSIKSVENKIKSMSIEKLKLANEINNSIDLSRVKIEKIKNLIIAKEYELRANEVKLSKLKRDYLRFKRLFNQNKVSKEKFEDIETSYLAFLNSLKALKASLNALKKDLLIANIELENALNSKKEVIKLSKLIDSFKFQRDALKKRVELINNHIKDSFIYSPFDGVVAKRFVNNDEVIVSGKTVLSVVNLENIYILDLLEEKKLKGIKEGCFAKVHIDALDRDFNGIVEKILPASAATFAILPRDISSGEFTKLQQRFFVKIKFNNVPKDIKIGMSGEVKISKCKAND